MTPKPKTPTASGISRLLSAAGHTRAVIKLHGGTAGFDVHAYYSTGGVRVEHYTNTMSTSGGYSEVKLDAYARTITEAGYDVSRPSPRYTLNGHPGARRGSSPGNTAAALDAIPRLAAGLSEDAEADAVRAISRWINAARAVPAIDEAEQWRSVQTRACPFCGCFFLRVLIDARGSPTGRIECLGHTEAGVPCRSSWASLADIVPDLSRADGMADG